MLYRALIAAIGLLCTALVAAAPVTVQFSGTVTSATNPFGTIAGAVGTSFSGHFTFDPTLATSPTAGTNTVGAESKAGCFKTVNGVCEGPTYVATPFTSYSIDIITTTFSSVHSPQWLDQSITQHQNPSGASGWFATDDAATRAIVGPDVRGGTYTLSTSRQFIMLEVQSLAAMFADVSDLTDAVDATDFAGAHIRLFGLGWEETVQSCVNSVCTYLRNDYVNVGGTLTSMTIVAPPTDGTVPNPGSLALACLALFGASAARRR